MKGFTITPVLFIGMFLIVGIMLLTFSDIDRKSSENRQKETLLKKLSYGLLEQEATEQNSLYLQSILGTVGASTDSQLKANITALLGSQVSLGDCQQTYFTVVSNRAYSKSQSPASINTTYTLYQNITCSDIQSLGIFSTSIQCPSVLFSC